MQAPSMDDEIRAVIIRDAISRSGLHKSLPEEQNHQDKLPEQAPTSKHHKLVEAATAAEITKPAKDEQTIEDRGVYPLYWQR